MIVGVLGLGLGWLSHFSSMTDQPVSVIYHGYTVPWAGLFAVGCFSAHGVCARGDSFCRIFVAARGVA